MRPLPTIVPPVVVVMQRTQKTLALLRDVVQESSANYWYDRGKAASAIKQWVPAAHAFEQCLRLEDNHWRGALQLAVVMAKQYAEGVIAALRVADDGSYSEWEEFVNELLPEQWEVLAANLQAGRSHIGLDGSLALALVYRAMKEGEKARRLLDSLRITFFNQAEQSAIWQRTAGALYYDQKEFENALSHYDRALKLNPSNAFTYIGRGMTKRALDDKLGATADFENAISLAPHYAWFYYNRALYRGQSEREANLSDVNRAIKLGLSKADAYLFQGDLKRRIHDYTGAIVSASNAIALRPNYIEAYNHRGCAKLALKNYVGAVTDFDTGIALGPSEMMNYPSYVTRGEIRHEHFQDYIGALNDFTIAITLLPVISSTYVQRAMTREKMGDFSGATADRILAARRGHKD